MIHIGCAGFPIPHDKYFKRFGFAEVTTTFFDLPRPGTLARLRKQAPPGFSFSMKASQLISHEASAPSYVRMAKRPSAAAAPRVGHLRDSAEVRAAWTATQVAAKALEANLILIETPASFTPSQDSREAVRRFFTWAPRDGRKLVWEPRGLWDRSAAGALAKELDLVLAEDPLNDAAAPPERAHGATAYLRIRSLGSARVSDSQLEKLLLACEGSADAYLVLETQNAAKDARRLKELVAELGIHAAAQVGADDEDDGDDDDADADAEADGETDDADADDDPAGGE